MNKLSNSKALKILFLSNGIFVFADRLLGPLYTVFAQKFDTNILSISFSWFVFMFSATIVTLIVGKYGDRVKEKENLLMVGFLIRVLCWVMYIFTTNYYVFLLIQIVLGIGEAIGSPAFDAIFAKHLDKGSQVKEYSEWKIVQNLSLAIASLLGGAVVFFVSFELLFLLMALLGLMATVIVFVQPRELL